MSATIGTVLPQILAIVAPLYIANVLIAKLGGGSLRAGLSIGTPAFLVSL